MRDPSLALPEGRIHAGIVPLHPAGDSSRDQPLLRHLAETLPPHGVAVLRYDRRRSEPGHDVPLEAQAEDARAAMAELRRLTGEPELPVGLWGFSQGAWAAMLAAADGAAYLVTVSGSGVSPAEQMRYGIAEQLRRAGYGEPELERLRELRAAYESYLRGARRVDEVARIVEAAASEPWFGLSWVPRELPDAGGWPGMDFDPRTALERLRCPVLAFFGDDDEWVPVEPSIERFRSAAAMAGHELSVVRLPGTSHEPRLESGAISPLYERELTRWIAGLA